MKKMPFYRLVVTDSRNPRDGRFIEEVGYYNPLTEPVELKINEERAKYWLGVGAQPDRYRARPAEERRSAVSMAELVRYIARSLVEKPDAVDVREVENADSIVVELRVDPDDMGYTYIYWQDRQGHPHGGQGRVREQPQAGVRGDHIIKADIRGGRVPPPCHRQGGAYGQIPRHRRDRQAPGRARRSQAAPHHLRCGAL